MCHDFTWDGLAPPDKATSRTHLKARLRHDVRYADDFVILTGSREEANAALDLVWAWVNGAGLTLHPEKTHVGGRAGGARFQRDRVPGQGFEFVMPEACVPPGDCVRSCSSRTGARP